MKFTLTVLSAVLTCSGAFASASSRAGLPYCEGQVSAIDGFQTTVIEKREIRYGEIGDKIWINDEIGGASFSVMVSQGAKPSMDLTISLPGSGDKESSAYTFRDGIGSAYLQLTTSTRKIVMKCDAVQKNQ